MARDFNLDEFVAGLPAFTDNPVDRLRHTVAAYADSADFSVVLTATSAAILGQPWTGLTHGDLRALLAPLDSEVQTAQAPEAPVLACDGLFIGKHPCVLPGGHDGDHSLRQP